MKKKQQNQPDSLRASERGTNAACPLVREPEAERFFTLENELRAELKPQGAMEEIYFADVVRNAWNLQRLDREEIAFGGGVFHSPEMLPALSLILRYRNQARRHLDSAFRNLRQLQQARQEAVQVEVQTEAVAANETKPIPAAAKPAAIENPAPKEPKLTIISPPKTLYPIT